MSEYCLRWNNHRPNLVTVFSELLTSEALVDVTLATDGHFIHAHKLVLSACSIYFKELFASNPCNHPIVILKDIRIDDLKTVIDFIYKGEVNVSQERLQDVLKTAESLRIEGLAESPCGFEEYSAQGQRLSTSSLGSQVTRQRSSLTDSREQSLSVEEEIPDGVNTPPATKRRKITSSLHGSSESTHDGNEEEDQHRVSAIKSEPQDDRDSEKSQSRDGDGEYSVNRAADAMLMLHGTSGEGEEGGPPAASSSSTSSSTSEASAMHASHAQGSTEWPLHLNPWWAATMFPALARHHQTLLHPSHQRYLPRPPPTTQTTTKMTATTTAESVTASSSLFVASGNNSSSREGSPAGSQEGAVASASQQVVGSIDQLTLVSVLGKEVSPQMIQALQAVASRRESFSSAAKLYSVSVTTLWRYFKKLGLNDSSHKSDLKPPSMVKY